jgi:hypothetical protein
VVVVSLKLVFTFTQKLIKCLGEVNLDSAAFQPSPSSQSQSQFPGSPSPSPSASSSRSVLVERKREGMYKLTSTSSRSSSDERNYLPTQPNTAKAASGNPPTQRGVLRTVPLGTGRKGICAEKAPHWKTGISWPQVLHCAVLCYAVQCFLLAIGTVRRCTHSNMCASVWLGSLLLASPPLSPLLLPPGHHDRKITPVHLHVHRARTQRDTVCCILYVLYIEFGPL